MDPIDDFEPTGDDDSYQQPWSDCQEGYHNPRAADHFDPDPLAPPYDPSSARHEPESIHEHPDLTEYDCDRY